MRLLQWMAVGENSAIFDLFLSAVLELNYWSQEVNRYLQVWTLYTFPPTFVSRFTLVAEVRKFSSKCDFRTETLAVDHHSIHTEPWHPGLNRPLFPTWSPGTTEYWWVYYNYNMFSILQVPRSKARWASSKKEERRRSVQSLRMVIGFRLNGCCCLSQIPGVVQQTDPINKQPTVPVDMLCWRHVSRAFHTPASHSITD